jgi:hypothetical protein
MECIEWQGLAVQELQECRSSGEFMIFGRWLRFTPTDSDLMQLEKLPVHLQVAKISENDFCARLNCFLTMTPELLNA